MFETIVVGEKTGIAMRISIPDIEKSKKTYNKAIADLQIQKINELQGSYEYKQAVYNQLLKGLEEDIKKKSNNKIV